MFKNVANCLMGVEYVEGLCIHRFAPCTVQCIRVFVYNSVSMLVISVSFQLAGLAVPI